MDLHHVRRTATVLYSGLRCSDTACGLPRTPNKNCGLRFLLDGGCRGGLGMKVHFSSRRATDLLVGIADGFQKGMPAALSLAKQLNGHCTTHVSCKFRPTPLGGVKLTCVFRCGSVGFCRRKSGSRGSACHCRLKRLSFSSI